MIGQTPLRVLLVGHGRFGREHHIVWDRLCADGLARIAGIVVATEESRRALARDVDVPVHCGFDGVDWNAIDVADIVTPAATHAALVRRLLPHVHVLVEKPLAETAAEAQELSELAAKSTNLLGVGHVYRFHPLIKALQDEVRAIPELPQAVFGTMLNPLDEAPEAADPTLEMLHLFDVIEMLFGVAPTVCAGERNGNTITVSLSYPAGPDRPPMNVVLRLGWEGTRRQRVLELMYSGRSLLADLADQMITVEQADSMRRVILPHGHSALEGELRDFVAAVQARRAPAVDAATGARMVAIANRARPVALRRRPKVAVIGGGIFGATAAAELGDFCDVTVIERHATLLAEASTLNQWRYHHGFHYPRSIEMINEIKECREAFEDVYGDAIIGGFASYYATARTARVITGERYLHICSAMGLDFSQELPPPGVIDADRVSLCLRTGEGVFDADTMRAIMHRRLENRAGITLALGHEVVEGHLLPDGRKHLVLRGPSGKVEEAFDHVINATYVNRNLLSRLFGFPLERLRFDVMELILLEVDLPRMSVTILDGPFTSLVSTGTDGQFTLSHIQHSLLAAQSPADGMPPAWSAPQSNRENILRHARHYMPALDGARYIGSRYGVRVVSANAQDVDGRPTVVVDHGFGCWSVLGGKVNTSVANARQIAHQIATAHGIDRPGAGLGSSRIADEGELRRDRSPVGPGRR